ncbi:hypothetical protein [Glaciihabitans sp. UYNi722]|uniref:hypothetical protein n=1 Tax=Glaciihabitans sp. UYNi722 TaxID=3156344 RepID=UPI00339AA88C
MNDIALPNDRTASQATAVEQARAVAEVAAAVRVAQDFPRDMSRAVEQMRMSCSQVSLAQRAFYSVPRAGGRVEGSTVHLAKELARCFGNVEYGMRETRRDDEAGISEVLAWAWDQENNVRQSRGFVVPHQIMKAGGRKNLTDLSDIANNNNSVAARALRECILTLLPVWFRDEAELIASRTLAGDGTTQPMPKRIADALAYFAREFNVTPEQIEARLARPRAKWTSGDLATLNVIGSEIGRGEKTVQGEFPEQPVDVKDLTAIAPPLDPSDPDFVAPVGS